MGSNTLKKKCPMCRRNRKYTVPPNHRFAYNREWHKINNVWICNWCYYREILKNEDLLRQKLKEGHT